MTPDTDTDDAPLTEMCDGTRGARCSHQDPNACNRERDCPAFVSPQSAPLTCALQSTKSTP